MDSKEGLASERRDVVGTSVLMLVANDVSHDTRVMKMARSLVDAGYLVSIVGVGRRNTEKVEFESDGISTKVVPYQGIEDEIEGQIEDPEAARLAVLAKEAAKKVRVTHDALVAGLGGKRTLVGKLALIVRQRIRLAPLLRPIRRYERHVSSRRRYLRRMSRRTTHPAWLPRTLEAARNRQLSFTRALMAGSAGQLPDIIHAHDLLTLPAAIQLKERIGCAVIYDAHELEMHRNKPYSFGRNIVDQVVEWTSIRKADAVITVGDAIADELARSYSIERPTVVMNSPRVAKIRSDPSGNTDVRRLAKLNPTDTVIAYSGIVAPGRNVGLLVKALNRLPEDHHVVVLGPRREDRDAELVELAASKNVASRFHLLPQLPPDDVPAALSTADVFVIPSENITKSYDLALSNKLFDAVFACVPVVVGQRTEPARFVEEYKVGISRDLSHQKLLAAAIKETLKRRDEFDLSDANIQRIREQFGWEAQSKRLLALYRSLNR